MTNNDWNFHDTNTLLSFWLWVWSRNPYTVWCNNSWQNGWHWRQNDRNKCLQVMHRSLYKGMRCHLDQASWSYGCMKIATLLFLSTYSLYLRMPHFLGPHDKLLCVLINQINIFSCCTCVLTDHIQWNISNSANYWISIDHCFTIIKSTLIICAQQWDGVSACVYKWAVHHN